MLCVKYGFAKSMNCAVQSSDRYFAQQSSYGFVVHSMDYPLGTLRKVLIKRADEVLFYFEVTA